MMPPRKIEGSREHLDLSSTVQLGPELTSDAPPEQELTSSGEGDSPRTQKVRVPFGGSEFKMTLEPKLGFHRHWFNDRPGRVDRAKLAGYEHVLNSAGQPVSMIVDTQPGIGGGMLAYAMEIPEELWLEDMKAQQKKIDDNEAVIKQGLLNHKPGDGRYIP